MKWAEGRALRKLNWKLPANKNKYTCRNSISRNPPKVTHEPITRIISKQLDIKLGPFIQKYFNSVLRKIKNRKAAGLDEMPPEVWKTRQFDILLRHSNAIYNQNPIDRWMNGCILPFPKKGQPRISQELPRYNTYIHSSQDIQCSIYATI